MKNARGLFDLLLVPLFFRVFFKSKLLPLELQRTDSVFSFIFFQNFLSVSIFPLDKMAVLSDNELNGKFAEGFIMTPKNPDK